MIPAHDRGLPVITPEISPSTSGRASAATTAARLCARDLVGGDTATVAALARRLHAPEWAEVLDAVSPALHAYLHFRLSGAGVTAALPADTAQTLARAGQAAAIMHLRQRSALRRAVARLNSRGIDAVLLKGAAVGPTIYPERSLRTMTDIDIWVPAGQLNAAVTSLLDHGFEVPARGHPTGRVSPAISQHRLRATDSGTLIELHGAVRSLEMLSPERVARCWARAVPLSGDNEWPVRIPRADDMLLHIALHLAATNRFANSQVGLLDLALLLEARRDQFDWAAVVADARTEGVAVYLALALVAAGLVWGARVPPEFVTLVGGIAHREALEALALEQVWTANTPLPYALERILRQPTLGTRVAAAVRRAMIHHHVPDPGAPGTLVSRVRSLARGVVHDLGVKVPGYARAWARGDLAAAELKRRAQLAGSRGQLGRLARDAEARLHPPPPRGGGG